MRSQSEQIQDVLTQRPTDALKVIGADDVQSLLGGREKEIMETVRKAYASHATAQSSLPHSSFLRFPGQPRNRIIALPAYLGDPFNVAGIKWIASFPGNHDAGLDRASAVIVLNSTETGRPEVLLEGSLISAKRTAASAALAAQYLHPNPDVDTVGLIGCGLINFEIARFLLFTFSKLRRFVLFDNSQQNAELFRSRCRNLFGPVEVDIVAASEHVFRMATLVSFATTASEPHVERIDDALEATTVLHVSLRDLSPALILRYDNVVDDIDHVCRAQTSLDLARQSSGHADFIRGTLGEIILGKIAARNPSSNITIFSPFGLGILDLALSKFVVDAAREPGLGFEVPSFLPQSWGSAKAL